MNILKFSSQAKDFSTIHRLGMTFEFERTFIKPEHNFLIEFNGNPPQVYAGQDSYTLQTTGDCIENICNFLKDIMGQANTVLTQNLQS